MCGFAVLFALNDGKADREIVERMTHSIRHRGPDGEGFYVSGPIGFGFRRLAILDLSPSGHQPMFSDDRQTILVFNGEIYNYVELRAELETLGHRFRSSGDTEVLLHAYQEWGEDCLHKLNGMWAFVFFDQKKGKLFGARDRFGVKPLYRYCTDSHVFFGSEIKAILASGYYRGGINWRIASKFLAQGYLDEDNESFYGGIESVSPGSAFEIDTKGRLRKWQYWSIGRLPKTTVPDPSRAFFDLFEDAVKLRMRSDVPVGVCLSGGLDSTSIICVMSDLMRKEEKKSALQAFSYISEAFDESAYISETIKQTDAELNRLETDPVRLWDRLFQVLRYHDEPVHSVTALISFELMGLAAQKGIKVVLNGQGADETIAGYHGYFAHYWHTLLRQGFFREAWREISAYAETHGEDRTRLFYRSLIYLFRSEIGHIPAYRSMARKWQRKKLQKHSWFTPEFFERFPENGLEADDNRLDAALQRSIERRRLPLYLRIEDRNSMAHSVEVRLPFMDYRLVSLLFNLPVNWKMRGPWNKYVLREAMRKVIPEKVRCRPDKMGFPTPRKDWFAGVLYAPMQELLKSRAMRERGIYNVDAIRRDLERHRNGQTDVANRLFNIAQFEAWSEITKTYFKG